VVLHAGDQTLHHPRQTVGFGRGQVVLLEGIVDEVIKLVAGVFGSLGRIVVVDDLPITASIASEVIASMRGVRVVHEKRLLARRVWLAREQRVEAGSIDDVLVRRMNFRKAEDRREQVVNRGCLTLNRAGGDRQTLLMWDIGT